MIGPESSRALLVQDGDVNTDTDNWAAFQAALQWQPDPVEIDLLHVHKKERGTDIISMLVAIYGSKELFINEYRCGPLGCPSRSRDGPERSLFKELLCVPVWTLFSHGAV